MKWSVLLGAVVMLARRGVAKKEAFNVRDMEIQQDIAHSAYCNYDKIQTTGCKRLINWLEVTEFYMGTSFDELSGYVGYDEEARVIQVAFRGTSNIWNWMTDLDFVEVW